MAMRPGVVPNDVSSDEEVYTDDEEAPLNGPVAPDGQPIEVTKAWDKFRTVPLKDVSGSLANKETVEKWTKFFKFVAYIVTFLVVLGSAAISKGTLLFMTSQIKPKTVHDYCPTDYGSGKEVEVTISQEERVSWIWAVFFSFITPEFFTWFRSMRICIFRKWKAPSLGEFFLVALFETLHVIGVAFLVYMVLPFLEVAEGAMITNCVCFVPALLSLLSRGSKGKYRTLKIIADALAIVGQLSGCFVWAVLTWTRNDTEAKRNLIWILPAALILASFGWWENYVDKKSQFDVIKYLAKVKENLKETRYFSYIFLSIWKMIVFFCSLLSIELIWNYVQTGKMGGVGHLFNLFASGFGEHKLSVTEKLPPGSLSEGQQFVPISSWPNTAAIVFGIQAGASLLCFLAGKFACKIRIQGFAYALPVNLTMPVTIAILITLCGFKTGNACIFDSVIPGYLFWVCPEGNFLISILTNQFAWLWLLWLLSQAWITSHLWTPKCERLATTEKLFVHPFYNSLLIDQAMSMNRRRDDGKDVKSSELGENVKVDLSGKMGDLYERTSIGSDAGDDAKRTDVTDSITRIYTCATMWHESPEEIVTFLKSIFYLDEDQSARRVAQKYLDIVDPDYYELETHIFFDDAFEMSDDNDTERVVNRYVVDLVNSMDEAASYVHQTNVKVRAPKKYPTPYGGRLVWTLPGKTKIICHLKDKDKIRHKKRWSQCMYMYYLLGHKLMDQAISNERKATIADNTYILALDGDIDFTPDAVRLLVDLMKKNRNLGAACGRIHPVGGGLIAWYQMFEYAIGHWLQKATEHMIGCVLCSPGCFSLFRAGALMDDNIMAKYTTISSEARHYVQYDQGEDRWLCTLMLQRGYRVEYSAASDAYTHCPEGFNEFFNQRRRWVPSTMANILDLLFDYKRTVQVNDNISLPYIFYQFLLMVGTVVGPGTIFLMIVGSVCAAFKVDQWTSFILNLIPIIIFMIVCLTTKSKTQLMMAQLMSVVYAIVMMAVLVGIILELSEDGINSPSGIFLLMTAASFIISAILHPQEFWCLPYGLVYYLTVPSMYLLLIIYSLSNLNDVSWGTRETVQKTKKLTPQEMEEEKKKAEAAAKQAKLGLWSNFFRSTEKDDDEGSIELSLAGLFKIMCCVHKKPNDDVQQLARIAESLKALNSRLDAIERLFDPSASVTRRRSVSSKASVRTARESGPSSGTGRMNNNDVILRALDEEDENEPDDSEMEDNESLTNEPVVERDDLSNPYWINDKKLKRGVVDFLGAEEVIFFEELIEKYLMPLDADPKKKEEAKAQLKGLRDAAVFSFYIINALYVTIVFLLTLEKERVYIRWPFGEIYTMKYSLLNSGGVVEIETEFLKLEPIGLVFVAFFGSVLIIQFVAMLFHRFGTMTHILASTDVSIFSKKIEDISDQSYLERHGADIARQLQKLESIDGGNEKTQALDQNPSRRRTLHFLEESSIQRQKTHDLEAQFRQRLMSITPEDGLQGANARRLSIRRDTLQALARRSSVMNEIRRRSSVHFTSQQRLSLSVGSRGSSISRAE